VFGYVLWDYRSLWHKASYWLLIAIFSVGHAMLLPWLQVFMNRYRAPATLTVALVEGFLFIIVISYVVDEETLDRE
jgi:hypothetical protein